MDSKLHLFSISMIHEVQFPPNLALGRKEGGLTIDLSRTNQFRKRSINQILFFFSWNLLCWEGSGGGEGFCPKVFLFLPKKIYQTTRGGRVGGTDNGETWPNSHSALAFFAVVKFQRNLFFCCFFFFAFM